MTSMARFLRYAVLAGEALLLVWLAATESLAPVGFLALGLLGAGGLTALVLTGWPFGALLLLTASSAMPRLTEVVMGLHLRPEHLAIGAVALVIAGQALKERRAPRFDLRTFDRFLLAYVGMNFLSSALTSPEPHLTLRWAALNAMVISPYFLLRLLITDESRLQRAFDILLWVGAAESAYGILCFLSNRFWQTSFGVEADQYGAVPGIYGTQYEANLFGSYTACCAIMFLACFMLSEIKSRRALYGFGFAVTMLGTIISLARSVFLAFPVAAFFVVWIALRKGQLQLRKLLAMALGMVLVLLIASPFILGIVRERFSTIDPAQLASDSTTLYRIVEIAAALKDVQIHPILGTGTASFQLFFDWNDYIPGMRGENDDPSGSVSSTPVRILHDTGFVGLIIFTGFLGSLAAAVYKAAHVAGPQTKVALMALSAGLLLYAITFQATEATILAFTWVHLGLLAAAVALVQSSRPRPEAITRT
jgi:oligosaccharide repeat unit polymerase